MDLWLMLTLRTSRATIAWSDAAVLAPFDQIACCIRFDGVIREKDKVVWSEWHEMAVRHQERYRMEVPSEQKGDHDKAFEIRILIRILGVGYYEPALLIASVGKIIFCRVRTELEDNAPPQK
jgi:hypothetical protein